MWSGCVGLINSMCIYAHGHTYTKTAYCMCTTRICGFCICVPVHICTCLLISLCTHCMCTTRICSTYRQISAKSTHNSPPLTPHHEHSSPAHTTSDLAHFWNSQIETPPRKPVLSARLHLQSPTNVAPSTPTLSGVLWCVWCVSVALSPDCLSPPFSRHVPPPPSLFIPPLHLHTLPPPAPSPCCSASVSHEPREGGGGCPTISFITPRLYFGAFEMFGWGGRWWGFLPGIWEGGGERCGRDIL